MINTIDYFIKELKKQFIDGDEIEINEKSILRDFDSWDSLTAMSIIFMIKEVYDFNVDLEDFKLDRTPEDLYGRIKKFKK
jgi:acyl carrier protein